MGNKAEIPTIEEAIAATIDELTRRNREATNAKNADALIEKITSLYRLKSNEKNPNRIKPHEVDIEGYAFDAVRMSGFLPREQSIDIGAELGETRRLLPHPEATVYIRIDTFRPHHKAGEEAIITQEFTIGDAHVGYKNPITSNWTFIEFTHPDAQKIITNVTDGLQLLSKVQADLR